MKSKFLKLLWIVMALMANNLSAKAEGNEANKITGFHFEKIMLFSRDTSDFNRIGEVAITGLPTLPIPIIESSDNGYVSINTPKGKVWIDEQDIKTSYGISVTASCDKPANYRTDLTNNSANGNIDGCKK